MVNQKLLDEQAEAKAKAMVHAVLGNGLNKLEEIKDGITKLEASSRDLKRQIEKIAITSGCHSKLRIAASYGRRVPMATIADVDFNHNERKRT